MNCNTYKKDTLQFLRSVADKKAERMQMTNILRNEVSSKMHYFHMKQASLKKQIMQQEKDLHEALFHANSQRLATFHSFSKQLSKEGSERRKGRIMLGAKVNSMLSEFNCEQQELKKELEQEAKSLHAHMKQMEKDRLHQFKTFQKNLEHEKKERHLKTANTIKQTQQFLNDCHKHQTDMAKAMQDQFSNTAKARQEIQTMWANISAGGMAHMKTAPMSSPNAESPAASNELTSAEPDPMNDLLMKIKAVISGFPEGCKFTELHRALGDISKTTTREAINQLLAAKEIRKDENDRFHLI